MLPLRDIRCRSSLSIERYILLLQSQSENTFCRREDHDSTAGKRKRRRQDKTVLTDKRKDKETLFVLFFLHCFDVQLMSVKEKRCVVYYVEVQKEDEEGG